jgi:hypothetical protein
MAKRKPDAPTQEAMMALGYRRTPDGFVVYRFIVNPADGEPLSPVHVRDYQETRPVDMVLKSEKVLEEGRVVLKPTRVVKGKPVLTTVGKHVVFGEMADSASQRAKQELQLQVQAELKRAMPTWRHLCAERLKDGLPLWLAQPAGAACAHCGREQHAKVRAA